MAHGKQSRKRQREKRLGAKRARRAALQAVWDALKGSGKNKKKKNTNSIGGIIREYARVLWPVKVVTLNRDGSRTTEVKERMVHGGPDCRNIGCKRCSSLWRV